MNEKVLLTEEGLQNLKERLEFLTKEERPAVVERLKVAREQGDLSENAEYTSAKEELAKVSGEIEEIEAKLKVAQVIPTKATARNVVSIGSKFEVEFLNENDEVEETQVYSIVGTAESKISEGRISNESALGSAVLGKKVGTGDKITVKAPQGDYQIRIVKIVK